MSDHSPAPQTVLPKTLNHNALVLGVFFLFVGFSTLFIDAQQLRQNALFILLQGLSFAVGGTFICAWLRYISRPRSRT